MTDRAAADERERYRTLCAGKEASDIHAFNSLQARVWEGKGLPDRCASVDRPDKLVMAPALAWQLSPRENWDSEGEICI